MEPITPAVSSTKPWVARSRVTSSWREPTSPLSSPTETTNSIVGCGRPGLFCSRVSSSRQPASPDLSSAPRIVEPSVRMTPSSPMTGVIPRSVPAVSMWVDTRIVPSRVPGYTANRFPISSMVVLQPSSLNLA